MSARSFDLNDFRRQITLMETGPIRDLSSKFALTNLDDMDGEVRRIQGIIDSMTPGERRNPHRISESRLRRTAAGAGVQPSDVFSFLREFDRMAAFVKQMSERPLHETTPDMTGLGRKKLGQRGERWTDL
jgi:signal recognition particle subunit SRP54